MTIYNTLDLGNYKIGGDSPIFIIAEIGLNHNQSLKMAKQLVDVAVDAGCSAAKFQTFKAKDVYVESNKAGKYKLMDMEIPIYALHESLEMPTEWIKILMDYCEKKGILFFTSPIGDPAVDLVKSYGIKVIKISSYECTNLPFIEYIASKEIPVILSTGACTLGEVEEAIEVIRRYHNKIALMHCVTKYPAKFSSANLNIMHTMRLAFNLPIGFSDNGFETKNNTIDFLEVPMEAAIRGADLFEIHITLDRSLTGPDHGFSLEPTELARMVEVMNKSREKFLAGNAFNLNETIGGTSVKKPLPEEMYVRNFAFKCLFSTTNIGKGELFNEKNVASLRPGEMERGLEPKFMGLLKNNDCRASRDIDAWSPIQWNDILNSP